MCKHRSAYWSRWEDGAWVVVARLSGPPLGDAGRFFEGRIVCDRCGDYMPLGPANNGRGSDFTIKMEIRAAALAVMPAGAYARNDEWAGWAAHDNGDSVPWDADGDEAQCWHAGYLARVIATHDQETP
jgi:hypothetical protein